MTFVSKFAIRSVFLTWSAFKQNEEKLSHWQDLAHFNFVYIIAACVWELVIAYSIWNGPQQRLSWSYIGVLPSHRCIPCDSGYWRPRAGDLVMNILAWGHLAVWSSQCADFLLSSVFSLSLDSWPFSWHCPIISLILQMLVSHVTCEL